MFGNGGHLDARHGGVRLAALARKAGSGGGGMCKMESGGGPRDRHSDPHVIPEKKEEYFNI